MKACVPFEDLLAAGQPAIDRMPRLIAEVESGAADCQMFFDQVSMVKGILAHTYSLAAGLARKTTNLSEVVEIWYQTSQFCQGAVKILAVLKEKHPMCSSPGLYDEALDYKLACDKRYRSALEEQTCLTHQIPPTLFPAVS